MHSVADVSLLVLLRRCGIYVCMYTLEQRRDRQDRQREPDTMHYAIVAIDAVSLTNY